MFSSRWDSWDSERYAMFIGSRSLFNTLPQEQRVADETSRLVSVFFIFISINMQFLTAIY